MEWWTLAPEGGPWVLTIALGIAGLAFVAYALKILDAAGAWGSFALGLLVALLGGIGWLGLMVAFTLLGSVATRIGAGRKRDDDTMEARDGERGAPNVIANGAAAGLAALATLVVPREAAIVAFATAIAAVTADTLASEIGSLSRRARRILPPFGYQRVGTNGAVSAAGQVAAFAGAASIALLAIPLIGLPVAWVWVPAVAGFVGCQLDSVLGATLERDALRDAPLSKQDVNFIASAAPALVVLVAAMFV